MKALRPRSATSGVIVLAVLVLSTSASSAHNGRLLRGRPRLVATPGRLAGAQSIAPGDRVQRVVLLRERGNGRFGAIYLVVRAKESSLLDTDRQHGLLIAIDGCSKKWRRHGRTYSCHGRRYRVLAERPLVGRARLRHLALQRKRTWHLRLILTLPAAADNAMQAQLTTVRYSFVGISR
jgi:hypothetical protein